MNLKKVLDSTLYSGNFIFGNINDRINLINRVCPSLSDEEMDELFDKLVEAGVEDSDKLFFVLGNEVLEGSILDYPVKDLTLSFRKV